MKTINLLFEKLAVAFALLVFAAGTAAAAPITPSGYQLDDGKDFWSIADTAGSLDGAGFFQIEMEEAAYESVFGLYSVDDIANPTRIENKFPVFQRGDAPGAESQVSFWNDNGAWKVTDQINDTNPEQSPWQPFSSSFGYYYEVDAGNNGSIDYTFYTASAFNTVDKGVEHIHTVYNPSDNSTYVYLEDLLRDNADWDWNDMTVSAGNTAPAPVPEPATMLLFGCGLIGFAFFARRRIGSKQ